MLIETLEKEKREIYERGKFDGKFKVEIEVARKILAKGFDLPLIAEVTGLPLEKVLQLKQESSK